MLTHAGLVAERVVRAFWPLWVVAALALAPVLMGWLPLMPIEAFWFYGVGTVAGLLGTLVWGLRRFAWPSQGEALARVDAALPGRPIAAIADRQAIGSGDAASEAVWRAHLARMEARTRQARAVEPDLRLSARDPYGLRYSALLFLLVAFLFGTLWRVGDVEAIGQGDGQAIVATGPVWEGWITPPSYTGRPALYLAVLTRVEGGSVRAFRWGRWSRCGFMATSAPFVSRKRYRAAPAKSPPRPRRSRALPSPVMGGLPLLARVVRPGG